MIYCTDVFGRELQKGDLVLTRFVLGRTNLLSVAEVVDIGSLLVLCTMKLSKIKIPSSYNTDINNWWSEKVYKISVDDYNKDFEYFLNNYRRFKKENPAKIYEFFGRNLQLGDFVFGYHCSKKGTKETFVYGLMLGSNQMFTSLGTYASGRQFEQCLKIENPSLEEEQIYQNIIEAYHLEQIKKQQEKNKSK